jgi:hypothetical protein
MLRLPLRHLQSLMAPDAFTPLAVHMPPSIAQQRRHPPIAITTILPRQRDDALGESCFVVRPAGRLALCRSVLPEHVAQPPPRHRHHRSDVVDTALSARGRRGVGEPGPHEEAERLVRKLDWPFQPFDTAGVLRISTVWSTGRLSADKR